MFKRRFLSAASRVWTHRRPSHQRREDQRRRRREILSSRNRTSAHMYRPDKMPGWNIIHAGLQRASSWSSIFPCHTPNNRIPQIWGELRSGTLTDRTAHLTVKPGSQRYWRVIRARWFQLRGSKTNLRLTGFKLEELIIPIDANQLSVDRSVSSLFSLVECQQGRVRKRWCHPYLTINQM